jgi:predicted ATP-dependent serine protease
MIEIKGSKKEKAVREWLNQNMDGAIPIKTKVIDVFRKFELDHPEISYGCLNGTMKKAIAEGHSTTESTSSSEPAKPIDLNIMAVEDMDFPNFKLYKTGKMVDDLMSDHEEGGGVYGGTVNIVIGESGVGKSTILLDALASVQEQNPEAKVLYISSEMTKNDIKFYHQRHQQSGRFRLYS